MDPITPGQPEDAEDGVLRAELFASLSSARHARSTVRRALATWGIDDPAGDAELLASELVANAAEHVGSGPIALILRRHALTAWGMDDPDGDAELLASELVANAAEHSGGPVGLALRRHAQPDGQRGITCEVTDTSPGMPRPGRARPDDERGRGLAIVTALADASGVRAEADGKTTWFTLALGERIDRATRQVEPEAEAGA